jgi:mono/diheme cytochrome c family protein
MFYCYKEYRKMKIPVMNKVRGVATLSLLCAALLAGCGGIEDLEEDSSTPVAEANLVIKGDEVSVELTNQDGKTDKWTTMKFDFAATVDAGPSAGTKLEGDLKLVSSKPAEDGSSYVEGSLVLPTADDESCGKPLTDEQKQQLEALSKKYREDVDAARKTFVDAVTPLVEQFRKDIKAAANEEAAKAVIDKLKADLEAASKILQDSLKTLSEKYVADARAIVGDAAPPDGGKDCRANAIPVKGKIDKDGMIKLNLTLSSGVIEGTGKADDKGNFAGTFKGPQTDDTGSWTAAMVNTGPTPTMSPSPTTTPTATPTPSPTAMPTPTKSPAPTPTATPTKSPMPTPTATPTKSPMPTPTATPTKSPMPTPSPTKPPEPTPSPTATPTPSGPNAVNGKKLYAANCASCHGAVAPDYVVNAAAGKPSVILAAIDSNKGGMGKFKGVIGSSEAADIAEWFKSPN